MFPLTSNGIWSLISDDWKRGTPFGLRGTLVAFTLIALKSLSRYRSQTLPRPPGFWMRLFRTTEVSPLRLDRSSLAHWTHIYYRTCTPWAGIAFLHYSSFA